MLDTQISSYMFKERPNKKKSIEELSFWHSHTNTLCSDLQLQACCIHMSSCNYCLDSIGAPLLWRNMYETQGSKSVRRSFVFS